MDTEIQYPISGLQEGKRSLSDCSSWKWWLLQFQRFPDRTPTSKNRFESDRLCIQLRLRWVIFLVLSRGCCDRWGNALFFGGNTGAMLLVRRVIWCHDLEKKGGMGHIFCMWVILFLVCYNSLGLFLLISPWVGWRFQLSGLFYIPSLKICLPQG